MPQIGPAEILVILLVALLVFGPKRLPEVGRQVGRGLRELRRFQETVRGEIDEVLHAADETPGPPRPPEPAELSPGAPRTQPLAPSGAPGPGTHAPSRFRAPEPAEVPPGAPRTQPLAPSGAPGPGTHAPSRFRAPRADPNA